MADLGKQDLTNKLIVLFNEVGIDYMQRLRIYGFGVYRGHDVHAFFGIHRGQDQVIHVQGYPGFSTEREGVVLARLMDYHRMMELRMGGCPIGNEHVAVIQDLISQTKIPYNPRVLEDMLGENLPQLR